MVARHACKHVNKHTHIYACTHICMHTNIHHQQITNAQIMKNRNTDIYALCINEYKFIIKYLITTTSNFIIRVSAFALSFIYADFNMRCRYALCAFTHKFILFWWNVFYVSAIIAEPIKTQCFKAAAKICCWIYEHKLASGKRWASRTLLFS